ncbi:hypothetical protein COY93_02975 [Candidatus Uhrbacteria bacterium CG_4_10_14_0_8_um_filter_58_22]|uniref:Uncharacterized protein n=1 Tax=Candidatus Uhrbacteria bacterium CG_4_10_14_0_8_um_filter_58_22 TaxID=1975029 RepID=A0A2M7Q9Q6_9BACT|nr:MAG: hypothetical protein AUJ19_04665 [Parcubacteria group bacterium CG1_02_58_44]PIY62483.1 MAG: hypothetical protein COY93_02975 [Candidatus Uhrbacteria bacterium CG_4_10_14_0_8_um_filter_58_22]
MTLFSKKLSLDFPAVSQNGIRTLLIYYLCFVLIGDLEKASSLATLVRLSAMNPPLGFSRDNPKVLVYPVA